MSNWRKLYLKIKNNLKQVRVNELEKLLLKAGFTEKQARRSSSHLIFIRNGKSLSIPFRQSHILQTYFEGVLEVIEDEFYN